MRPWKEVYNDPENAGYTPDDWQKIRKDYFDKSVVPQLKEQNAMDQYDYHLKKFNEHADALAGNNSKPNDDLKSLFPSDGVVEFDRPQSEKVSGKTYSPKLSTPSVAPDKLMERKPSAPVQREGMDEAFFSGLAEGALPQFMLNLDAKLTDTERNRNRTPYQPKSVMEEVLYGAGNIAGDMPLFVAGGPMGGFGASRMMRKYNEIADEERPYDWADVGKVSLEGGKGMLEGLVLDKVQKGTKILGDKINTSLLEKLSPTTAKVTSSVLETLAGTTADATALTGLTALLDQHAPTAQNIASNTILSLAMRGHAKLKERNHLKGQIKNDEFIKKISEDTGHTVKEVKKNLETPDRAEQYAKHYEEKAKTEERMADAEIKQKAYDESIRDYDNYNDAQREFIRDVNSHKNNKGIIAQDINNMKEFLMDNEFFQALPNHAKLEFIKENFSKIRGEIDAKWTDAGKPVERNYDAELAKLTPENAPEIFNPYEMMEQSTGVKQGPKISTTLKGQKMQERRALAVDQIMSDIDTAIQLGQRNGVMPIDILNDITKHVNPERMKSLSGIDRQNALREVEMKMKEKYNLLTPEEEFARYSQAEENKGPQYKYDEVENFIDDIQPVGTYTKEQYQAIQELKNEARYSDLGEQYKKEMDNRIKTGDLDFLKDFKEHAERIIHESSSPYGEKKATHDMLKWFDKYFITSFGKSITDTQAGMKMNKLAEEWYRDGEMKAGGLNDELIKAITPILKNKHGLSRRQQELLIDFLNNPLEIRIEKASQSKLSDTQINQVREAYEKVRPLLDKVFMEAKEIGLSEYHPEVQRWTIDRNQHGRWEVFDGKKGLADFATYEEAKVFKNNNLITELQYSENYFSHMVDPKYLKPGKHRDKLLDYLIETGQVGEKISDGVITRNMAEAYLDATITEKRFGNLQIARQLELPDWAYRKDIGVIKEYLESTAMRIEQARKFGAKDENLYKMVLDVAQEAGQMFHRDQALQQFRRAQKFADVITGRMDYDPHANIATNLITNSMVVSKMALSQLGQFPQMMAGVWRGNATSWGKAIGKLTFGNREEAHSFVTRSGSNLALMRKQMIRHAMGDTGFTSGFLAGTGFTKMDAVSRTIANVTGMFYTDHLVGKLNKDINNKHALRQLDSLGLDVDAIINRRNSEGKIYLTENEKLISARQFEVDTNFRARAIDLPEFRTTNTGKLVTQFKSFMYSQTKTLKKHVWGEAKVGNFQPLIYLLLISGVSGAVVNEVRGMITGRDSQLQKALKDGDEEWLQTFVDGLSTAGALGMFEMAMQSTKYGDPQLGAFAGTLLQMGSRVADFYKTGHTRHLAAGVAEQLPMGTRWRREIQGYNKELKNEERKKNDPYGYLMNDFNKKYKQKYPSVMERLKQADSKSSFRW